MFLTSDNKIMWRRLGYGTLVTGALVLMGVCGLDIPVYTLCSYIGGWPIWAFLGNVFNAKVWLVVTTIVLLVYGVKRLLKTIESIKNRQIDLSFSDIAKETWNKTKNSNAFLIFSSAFCACASVWALKIMFARLRPVFVMSGLTPEFNRFIWEWHSMPSGHTTVTFAGLVMIGMLAPRFKPLTWTLACLVGFSRVCIGAHWPSDVILGAFVGMVIADFVKAALLYKSGKNM